MGEQSAEQLKKNQSDKHKMNQNIPYYEPHGTYKQYACNSFYLSLHFRKIIFMCMNKLIFFSSVLAVSFCMLPRRFMCLCFVLILFLSICFSFFSYENQHFV